jgi:ornithine carbamoyltransferase
LERNVRNLLEIDDLSRDELLRVLDLSEVLELPAVLHGTGSVLLFEKPSARTRTSMEMATVQLGGHPVTLRSEEVGIDSRESAEDLGRLFSGYGSIIGARVFEHHKIERLASAASVPVVNLLSDEAHPVQALADLLTIRQSLGRLEGVVVAYIGDANNVARSLGVACGLVGAKFRVSSPPGYRFDDATIARLVGAGADPEAFDDPRGAVDGADVVYTDAWYSMGQESERRERREAFADWQVGSELMSLTAEGAVFLHCLPAHRGDEATDEVLDGPSSRIWLQAENRMHTARGLLAWLVDEGIR